jgi:hypothetical protein
MQIRRRGRRSDSLILISVGLARGMYTAVRDPVNRNTPSLTVAEIDCGTHDISEILQPRRSTTLADSLDRIASRLAQRADFK